MAKMFCDLYQDENRFAFVCGRIGNTLIMGYYKERLMPTLAELETALTEGPEAVLELYRSLQED